MKVHDKVLHSKIKSSLIFGLMEHNEFVTTAITDFLSAYWDGRLTESFQSDILGNRRVRHSATQLVWETGIF